MQNKGVFRTERNAIAASRTTTAISQSCRGRREKTKATAASAIQKKNAAWSQPGRAGFHSLIFGRNHNTLPTSHRINSTPYGLASSASADRTVKSQSHKLVLGVACFSMLEPMKSGANFFKTPSLV